MKRQVEKEQKDIFGKDTQWFYQFFVSEFSITEKIREKHSVEYEKSFVDIGKYLSQKGKYIK